MTTISDEPALLRSILDNPDEDTHRLVYADWLNENGQAERAEFIRVQCRIAALQRECWCGSCVKLRGGGQHHNGPCAVDKERDYHADSSSRQAFLRKREYDLWVLLSQNWVNSCRPLVVVHLGDVQTKLSLSAVVRRGFVHSITCTASDWLAHADTLLVQHPVREVTWTRLDLEDSLAIFRLWLACGNSLDQPAMGSIEAYAEGVWKGIKFTQPKLPTFEQVTADILNGVARYRAVPPNLFGFAPLTD